MAFGCGADDCEPEAGAGLAAGAAPETCEGPLRLRRPQPGPLVGDGQAGHPCFLLGADRDPAACRPVELGVADEVGERTLERGLIALDGHGLECAGPRARPRRSTGALAR